MRLLEEEASCGCQRDNGTEETSSSADVPVWRGCLQRCPEVGSSQTLSPVKWELMRVVGRGQREKSEPQQ